MAVVGCCWLGYGVCVAGACGEIILYFASYGYREIEMDTTCRYTMPDTRCRRAETYLALQ